MIRNEESDMSKRLFIAEKPSVAREIAYLLGASVQGEVTDI